MVEPVIKVDNDELVDALEGKTTEEEEVIEEIKAEEGEEEAKTEEPSELDKLRAEQAELRQLLLEQKKQNAMLDSRLKRLSRPKTVVKTDEEEEEEEGVKPKGKKEEPSEVEALEEEVKALHNSKDGIFELQLEVMSESKKFPDAASVCSEANINDIMDAISKQVAEDQGLDYHHASLEVEKFIWSHKKPYNYLYDLIKEYHPKYSGKSKGQDTSTETGKKEGEKKKSKAPGSIAEVPSSEGTKTGWTSARIDAMNEIDLQKVPKDIYEKYLIGELE